MSNVTMDDRDAEKGEDHLRRLAALTDQEFVERAAMWMQHLVIWTWPNIERLRTIAARQTDYQVLLSECRDELQKYAAVLNNFAALTDGEDSDALRLKVIEVEALGNRVSRLLDALLPHPVSHHREGT